MTNWWAPNRCRAARFSGTGDGDLCLGPRTSLLFLFGFRRSGALGGRGYRA